MVDLFLLIRLTGTPVQEAILDNNNKCKISHGGWSLFFPCSVIGFNQSEWQIKWSVIRTRALLGAAVTWTLLLRRDHDRAVTSQRLSYSDEMIRTMSFGVMTISPQTVFLLKPLIKFEWSQNRTIKSYMIASHYSIMPTAGWLISLNVFIMIITFICTTLQYVFFIFMVLTLITIHLLYSHILL